MKHIIHRNLKEATATAIDFVTQKLGLMSQMNYIFSSELYVSSESQMQLL